MICDRYKKETNDSYYEWCDLQINYEEIRIIVRSLEYYTDKRRLDFNERMKAGDMARQIRYCEIMEANK